MNTKPNRLALAVATGTSILVATYTSAQQPSEGGRYALEEVMVTAQKREQSLQDVPLAVNAISGDDLSKRGIFKTTELSSQVPNLQVSSFFGESQPNFIMRGIGVGNEFSATQASPVGVYVDENYLAVRMAHGAQLFDIERMEFVKGPQGTLYGRNTTGGAINVITNKPTMDATPTATLRAGFGNYDRIEGFAMGDATLVPDVLGVRAAVNYVKHDGYIDNKLPNHPDMYSADNISGRLSFRLQPTDLIDLDLKLYHSDFEERGNVGIGVGYGPNGSDASGYSRPDSLDFWESEINYSDPFTTEASGIQFTANIGLSDSLTLTSMTAYDEGDAWFPQDIDGGPNDVLQNNWGTEYDQFNQDLRLNYASGPLNAIGGIYYGEDTIDVDKTTFFFGFLGDDSLNFNLLTSQERVSTAIYGEIAYEVLPQLTLTLGARYTEDKVDFSSQSFLITPEGDRIINLVPSIGVLDPSAFVVLDDTTSKVTGRFIMDYRFTDDIMAYASYSTGYRAPAINGNADTTDEGLGLVPEELVDAYEIGVKSRLFNNLAQVNASMFYMDYEDQQLQEVLGVFSVLRSAGEATSQGLELELDIAATDRLRISGNLGWLDTEYKELILSDIDLRGNSFINAPELTATIGVDWLVYQGPRGAFDLHVDAVHTSEQFFSPFNEKPSNPSDTIGNSGLSQDSFTMYNARLTYDANSWSASLWGKNLSDEEFLVYGLDIRGAAQIDYVVRGTPRTFGADITLYF